jgi:protein-S-isoprenylcysteine O-methyltransferase Ste14
MNALELKVPPLALGLVFAGTMWLGSAYVPSLAFALPWRRAVALTFVSAGVAISLAGIVVFRQAKTTVNPIKPETTSTMVTSGVYRFSRNPMYLGFLFVLIGWAAVLSHILAFAVLPLFVTYMNRFQILPEERALSAKFGEDFTKYRHSVRRWL